MLRSDLCDSSDVYVVVKRKILQALLIIKKK